MEKNVHENLITECEVILKNKDGDIVQKYKLDNVEFSTSQDLAKFRNMGDWATRDMCPQPRMSLLIIGETPERREKFVQMKSKYDLCELDGWGV